MIRRIAVIAAAVGTLPVTGAGAGAAGADSAVYRGHHDNHHGHQGHQDGQPVALCAAGPGHDGVVANCGKTYVRTPDILGGPPNPLSLPPTTSLKAGSALNGTAAAPSQASARGPAGGSWR
ncbi:hypothetical protein ABT093_18400 [Kitasatospora sp. NPDC002551]|uniref:hypothetical protein n=1 Tax=Kitasatospora sp. NPDC002551 TaxID=3154539 RepID=UPI00332E634D